MSRCTCGSEAVGSPRHSDWCDKDKLKPLVVPTDDLLMSGLSAWPPQLPKGNVPTPFFGIKSGLMSTPPTTPIKPIGSVTPPRSPPWIEPLDPTKDIVDDILGIYLRITDSNYHVYIIDLSSNNFLYLIAGLGSKMVTTSNGKGIIITGLPGDTLYIYESQSLGNAESFWFKSISCP